MTLRTPDYAGGSIVNLAASVLAAFGIEPPAPPLRAGLDPGPILAAEGGVVLLVIDALGRGQLQRGLEAGVAPRLAGLVESAPAGLQELTSVFPSTTTAALNSLATARPPAEHGILGHMLWFEKLENVVNMLTLHPIGDPDPIDEERLRRVPTVYQLLGQVGVPSALITDAAFEGTAFTSLLQAGSRLYGYEGLSQIPYQLQRALDDHGGQRAFYSLYWPLIDTLSHAHGPDDGGAGAAAGRLELEFIDLMVGKVADLCRRRGCALLLAADHGQIALDPARAFLTRPTVDRRLVRPPGGGRRALYLSSADPEGLLADPDLGAATAVLRPMDGAIADGWFGGPCDGLRSRLGDVLAIGAEGVQLLYNYGRGIHPQAGSHGGLTPAEMDVPLIAVPPS